MAGQRGPTAVHIFTILFGMASLILAVMTYISAREYLRVSEQVLAEKGQQATFESQAERLKAEIDALSVAIGFPGMEVGGGAPGEDSVLGNLTDVLAEHGANDQGQNFDQTLDNMRAHINTQLAAVQQSQASLQQATQQLLDAEGVGQANIDGLLGQQGTDETDLVRRINDNAEEIADLEADIDRWRNDLQRAQAEKEDLRDQLAELRTEGARMIALLDDRVVALINDLNRLKEVAFDVPHGHIIRVENVTQLVYIDIGSRQLLKPGVAFNVYVQSPRDNGRGAQDIKGSIEVMNILGETQAECRVLTEDHSRPIAAGDPIYSPIWREGVADEYAFVGKMDLDNDGRSDWERIGDLVELSGGRVEFYVDDDGNLQPSSAGISSYTTYLVVGEIPNPDDFFGDPEAQEAAANMQAMHRQLTRDAQWYGVRVLRRNDFLTHINWKPDVSRSRITSAGNDIAPGGASAVRSLLEPDTLSVEP